MPKPKCYSSRLQLIADLQKLGSRLFTDYHSSEPDLAHLIRESVGSNTFRAFQGLKPVRPSELFRTWANAMITPSSLKGIAAITAEADYSQKMAALAKDLSNDWLHRSGTALSYGGSRKLTDLLMKNASRWGGLSQLQRKQLIQHLHVPLDKFSLTLVRNITRNEATSKFSIQIPSRPTMSFVKDKNQYKALQDWLREVAKEANVPPIWIDLLAWNSAH